jgi:hypothetical protein
VATSDHSLPVRRSKEIGSIYFAANTAQARATLFPIILYVNLYCGMLKIALGCMITALLKFSDGLVQFDNRSLEARPCETAYKTKDQ